MGGRDLLYMINIQHKQTNKQKPSKSKQTDNRQINRRTKRGYLYFTTIMYRNVEIYTEK